MKTEAMSLTISRRMTASIRRTSSTKLWSSSRALRTFTEQSHNEVRGCLKGGSGKGGRKEIMTNFDEFSILRSMDNVRSSLCMRCKLLTRTLSDFLIHQGSKISSLLLTLAAAPQRGKHITMLVLAYNIHLLASLPKSLADTHVQD
ncbi:hypothetical protein Tco_1254810 [Tanacetum coccineum]